MRSRTLPSWIGRFTLAAAACAAENAGAQQLIYECVGDGYHVEVSISDGEWYERQRGGGWKTAGCVAQAGSSTSQTVPTKCTFTRDKVSVLAPLLKTHSATPATVPMIEKTLGTATKTYSFVYRNMGEAVPTSMACETYAEGEARPSNAWPLTRKVSAGRPFVLILDRSALTLKSGSWQYDAGRWVIFEGQYHPASGIWATRGVGFDPKGNPLHSCPAGNRCGGVHEPGKTLDRWHRPELGEMVVLGQALTFDERGSVLKEGKVVGKMISPDF